MTFHVCMQEALSEELEKAVSVLHAYRHLEEHESDITEEDWCNFLSAFHETHGMMATREVVEDVEHHLLPVSRIRSRHTPIRSLTSFIGHVSEWQPTPAGHGLLHLNVRGVAQVGCSTLLGRPNVRWTFRIEFSVTDLQAFTYFKDVQLYVEACGEGGYPPEGVGTHMLHGRGMKRVVLPPGYAIVFPPGCYITTRCSAGLSHSLQIFTRLRRPDTTRMCDAYVRPNYRPPSHVHNAAWSMLEGFRVNGDVTAEQYAYLASRFDLYGSRPCTTEEEAHPQQLEDHGRMPSGPKIRIRLPKRPRVSEDDVRCSRTTPTFTASSSSQFAAAFDNLPEARVSDASEDVNAEYSTYLEHILPGHTSVQAGRASWNIGIAE